MDAPGSARFRPARRLGRGGISEVLLCEHLADQRLVVIRRLLPHLRDRRRVRDAFMSASKRAAQLDDPRVQTLEEVDAIDGEVFTVSPYLRGETVRDLVAHHAASNSPIPIGIAARILHEATSALAVAHGDEGGNGGVLHLDVRPSNIIVTYDGTVHVMDFGLARTNPDYELTKPGTLKERYAYASLEQANDDPIGPHSDLYQLGLVMWEMLTGRRVFEGSSPAEVLEHAMNVRIPPPSTLRADVPPTLDRIVSALVDRHSERRLMSAQRTLDLLERYFALVPKPTSLELAQWMREEATALHHARLHQERTALSRKSRASVSDSGRMFFDEEATSSRPSSDISGASAVSEVPPTPAPESPPPANRSLVLVLAIVLVGLIGLSAYLLGAASGS